MLYLFFKWLHIVAVISWMAGILYLIRLFVHHRERGTTSRENHELLSMMESKLYRVITFPAMVVAWVAAISMLVLNPSLLSGLWLQIKLGCVVLLTLVTCYCGHHLASFAKYQSADVHSGKFYRVFNELPTILMFVIVWMVVFKPFSL